MRSVRTRFFIFYPHSYGITTLMRIGFKFPSGHKLLLHHFRPHADDDFHDHPWAFRTRVLYGSYVDESWVLTTPERIDAAVEQWHGDLTGAPLLHEYLGWTWEEYAANVQDPAVYPLRMLYRDVLRRGSTRSRGALHAHRTSSTGHVLTLVLSGPKERDWCRGTPETWVCEGDVEDFDAMRGMVRVRG